MANSVFVSLDSSNQSSEILSDNSLSIFRSSRTEFSNLISQGYPLLVKYYPYLSPLDQDMLRLYYIYGMSQNNIANLMGWVQAAVSRRIKSVFDRIKFLIKRPTNNPIEVREDLMELFPDHLFEFAYFFYWELTQNRVKLFIESSQSGAANKLIQIIDFLESEKSRVSKLSLEDPSVLRTQYLVLTYLEHFYFIRERSNILSFLYKKNDFLRSHAHYKGESIFHDNLPPLKQKVKRKVNQNQGVDCFS